MMGENFLQYEENTQAVTELPANVAVHCRNVVKSYGSGTSKVMALRGIDLDVYRGELMMLVGPSGCGKTTLISVVAGILDQDSGDCRAVGEGRSLLIVTHDQRIFGFADRIAKMDDGQVVKVVKSAKELGYENAER